MLSRLAAAALLIGLVACAPQSRFPDIDQGLAEAEARKQRIEAVRTSLVDNARAYRVHHAIMSSNAEFCGEDVQRQFGFSYQVLENYPSNWQAAALHLGIGEHITVTGVSKGSPAEAAGLMKGDRIVGVGGHDLGAGKAAATSFAEIRNGIKTKEIVVAIERAGRRQGLTVTPVVACNTPLAVLPDSRVNAYADGNGIYVTTGMLRFARSDDELALVIGHELAHNTRGHIAAKMGNMLLGALLGAGLSVATGVNVTDIGTRAGAAAFSQEFEAEADYVGVYHAARAGYDIASAASFWRKLGAEHPQAINLQGSTHPSTAKRYLAVEKAVEEFQRKKAAGLPLVPEEKAE